MKETRRLDVLAAIGGVLAVVCLVLVFAFLREANRLINVFEGREDLRPAFVKQVRQSDLRADLEIMLREHGEPNVDKIKKALKKYPDSPRLNLRLGIYGEEPLASDALRRLSKLDPNNALPLYLLAAKAASKGSWDQAQALVKQGDRMPRLDPYKLPCDLAKGDGFLEMTIHTVDVGTNTRLAGLGISAGKHALRLHAQGRDAEALSLLADVRQLGRRLMHLAGADMIDVLAGSLIIRRCNEAAGQIAKDTSDKEQLADVRGEMERCLYIRAGCRQYTDTLVDSMLGRLTKFFTLSFSLYGLLHLSVATLGGLTGFWIGGRKSKGMPVSTLHDEATAAVFTCGRMLSMYAIVFLACSASTLMLASMPDAFSPVTGALLFIGILIPTLVPLWMSERIKKQYKETYNRLAEQRGVELLPIKLKLMTTQDRRMITRRLAGMDGGFLITLAIWATLLSIGLKLHFNAYPWQINKTIGGMPQAEMRYVKDLVDGKIKVPQKYIDEVKREEARRNAQHPMKAAGGPK